MELGSRYMHVDGAILVAVPGGPFLMGSENLGYKEHQVTLDYFWIYTSEVTNGQYAYCLESGQCTSPDADINTSFENPLDMNLPVTGVNYEQAAAYCAFIHGRLPTEAEWEMTARGPAGNPFPWGDAPPICNLLNFNFCKGKTTDVTAYQDGASYYGALDMSGNVREWVADWFGADYYEVSPEINPPGPASGEKRSVRSSSFADGADAAFSAQRFQLKPGENASDLGFRCVVEDPTYFAPYCQTVLLEGADSISGLPLDDVIPVSISGVCVQPKMTHAESCQTQATYITVHPDPLPAGAHLDVPASCVGGPPTFKCTGDGMIVLYPQDCPVADPPEGWKCGPGYVYDGGDYCVGTGPGENCMPGFNYDPAAQCCVDADPSAKKYHPCPPGFWKQGNICLAANNPPPLMIHVMFFHPVAACGSGGNCVPKCTTDDAGDTTCTTCP